MTYEESLQYLSSLGRFGIKLGLERTLAILKEMGNPQQLFQGVHVAGTNGKGSVCAMSSNVLQSAGYRVGLMPKPHLISYTERIQVDQRPIREDDFAGLLTELRPLFDRVAAEHGPPTEFEILTAAALYYFARASIDLLVCEVGLGGRLDATNVLDLGVEVITNIALDHTQHLGSTLEQIAAEKAGILKEDSLAITGAASPALEVIETVANRLHIPLLRLNHEITYTAQDRDWSGSIVSVTTPARTTRDLRVPLLGLHQAENAALAVAAIEGLRSRGWDIPAGALRDGIARARWPGRLDVIGRDPIVLVDGAHNPAGLERAVDTVDHLSVGKPLVVVFGAMKDKDLPTMMAILKRLHAMVVFSGIDWHRAETPARLAHLYGQPDDGTPIRTTPTSSAGLAYARQLAGKHGIVFVCGSLYLVGEVMTAVRQAKTSPREPARA
jgi:dihydrofolate synthase/folylpolyglutamate synthase